MKHGGEIALTLRADGTYTLQSVHANGGKRHDKTYEGGYVLSSPSGKEVGVFSRDIRFVDLLVSSSQASRLGYSSEQIKKLREISGKWVPLKRYLYDPKTPSMGDLLTTILAPEGQEQEMRKRIEAAQNEREARRARVSDPSGIAPQAR